MTSASAPIVAVSGSFGQMSGHGESSGGSTTASAPIIVVAGGSIYCVGTVQTWSGTPPAELDLHNQWSAVFVAQFSLDLTEEALICVPWEYGISHSDHGSIRSDDSGVYVSWIEVAWDGCNNNYSQCIAKFSLDLQTVLWGPVKRPGYAYFVPIGVSQGVVYAQVGQSGDFHPLVLDKDTGALVYEYNVTNPGPYYDGFDHQVTMGPDRRLYVHFRWQGSEYSLQCFGSSGFEYKTVLDFDSLDSQLDSPATFGYEHPDPTKYYTSLQGFNPMRFQEWQGYPTFVLLRDFLNWTNDDPSDWRITPDGSGIFRTEDRYEEGQRVYPYGYDYAGTLVWSGPSDFGLLLQSEGMFGWDAHSDLIAAAGSQRLVLWTPGSSADPLTAEWRLESWMDFEGVSIGV